MAARKIDQTKSAPPDIFALPVLPAADVFPMMQTSEFAELVEDIREHGLREPLVTAMVDGELVLVDGRNRRAACQEAGIEPAVRQLDGEDPIAFVISANIHRRHMTRGQRAMATAQVYPVTSAWGEQGDAIKDALAAKAFSGASLSQARTVLRFTPEAVPNVMGGARSLDDAYQEAKAKRERSELESTKLEEAATKLAKRMEALRLRDEGLHDKVVDGEMTIKEAEKEADNRDKIRENEFDSLTSALGQGVSGVGLFSTRYPNGDIMEAFMQDPARRRTMRKRAFRFGHLLDKQRAEEGMERVKSILDLLHATEDEDGGSDDDV